MVGAAQDEKRLRAGTWKRTESRRRSLEKKTKIQEAVEKELAKEDSKMSDLGTDDLEESSAVVKVRAWMLQAISEWERLVERKRDGTVRRYDRPCGCESVGLERGWTVGGFTRLFSDADFDAHRVGYFCCCKNVSKHWME